MADILVMDWMEEFDSLTESEIHTYAAEQEHNVEVMLALYVVLEDQVKLKSGNLIDGICRQFLEFYRSGEKQLKKFVIQYIPTLIHLHLSDIYAYPAISTFLVSIFNLEVVDEKGQPKVLSFRVPSIAQSSIYHDATNLEPSFIAESSLRRWEECNTKLVSWGPLQQVDRLNAQNRQRVVTALMFLFNQNLVGINVQGLEHTCKAISRLVTQGFHHFGGSARSSVDSDSIHHMSTTPRLTVSSPLLLEMLHVVYHSIERMISGAAQALSDITYRASYEAYADVLLAANAVHNVAHNSPSVSITPRISKSQIVSKSMITNASFRTKKLPDDIPIQDDVVPAVHHQDAAALDSITEEQEEHEKTKGAKSSSSSSVGALKHLPKLPGLSKKHKAKANVQQQQQQQQQIGGDAQQHQHIEMMMAAAGVGGGDHLHHHQQMASATAMSSSELSSPPGASEMQQHGGVHVSAV